LWQVQSRPWVRWYSAYTEGKDTSRPEFPHFEKLTLENFTVFSQAEFEFSPGFNVFIGENGAGKTHVLKVLNAFANAPEVNDGIHFLSGNVWGSYQTLRLHRHLSTGDFHCRTRIGGSQASMSVG
jgi:ABC-type molybdenum transport system ATPase subunit/photorepair protein PhrA